MNFAKLQRSALLAIRSLWLHKLRAFLSVLGIIIGTGAVIALMAFGEGNMKEALDDIKRQGATNVVVRSIKPSDDSSTGSRSFVASYGLTFEDLSRLQNLDGILSIVPMRIFPQEIRRFERLVSAGRLVATVPEYAIVNKLELSTGRFITEKDNREMNNVCVIATVLTCPLRSLSGKESIRILAD